MLYRLGTNRQRVELLEMLFPNGSDQLPLLSNYRDEANMLNALAAGYLLIGQAERGVPLLHRAIKIYSEMKRVDWLGIVLGNLSETLFLLGKLHEAETTIYRALVIAREMHRLFSEAVTLRWLGLMLAARGVTPKSEGALQRACRIQITLSNRQGEGYVNAHLAQRALWLRQFADALSFANRAWELAHVRNYERDLIRAARMQGEAVLGLNDWTRADEWLNPALTRARSVNLVEEELPALVALAELRRRQGDEKAARELLDDVWEAAERGPYPLVHADACNVLAQIERDAGNEAAAVEAATRAYKLAWCDGPPFAYHWGLEKARRLLRELGAAEPEMPAFDESKFEPIPEVEIDPADEFGAGSAVEVEGKE